MSGGVRCNVTHSCFDIADISRKFPRGQNFVKKTFHQFFTTDTINWFEERGVKLKTEDDGRMFPVTDLSQTIIDCLLKEANKFHIEILMNTEVKELSLLHGPAGSSRSLSPMQNGWSIKLSGGRLLTADFVCIASGGYPKSGMFNWLKQLGHEIEEPVPSLFTFNLPHHPITRLMGISVEKTRIRIIGTKLEEQGPLLITHWGLSGPAVLRLSAWGARQLAACSWQFTVIVNWLPEFNEQSLREKFIGLRNNHASQKVLSKNSFDLPNRLWEFLAEQSGVKHEMRWADLPAVIQNKFIKNLCAYECEVKGKTTFKEEFVTAGGIKLNGVDANTLMSRKVPNLFFAGEVLDVDGITGGFNFQHAWTSGFIAAKNISELSKQ